MRVIHARPFATIRGHVLRIWPFTIRAAWPIRARPETGLALAAFAVRSAWICAKDGQLRRQ